MYLSNALLTESGFLLQYSANSLGSDFQIPFFDFHGHSFDDSPWSNAAQFWQGRSALLHLHFFSDMALAISRTPPLRHHSSVVKMIVPVYHECCSHGTLSMLNAFPVWQPSLDYIGGSLFNLISCVDLESLPNKILVQTIELD
jgi:hypothetical protein